MKRVGRHPAVVARIRQGVAGGVRPPHREHQVEVREGVLDLAGDGAPGPGQSGRGDVGRARRRPVARRHLDHAAQQTLVGAPAHEHGPVGALDPEGGAVPRRALALRAFAGKFLGDAAAAPFALAGPRARAAGRRTRGAYRRTQIHQRLREVARAVFRNQIERAVVNRPLRLRQGDLDGRQPRDDALGIAVDGRGAAAMSDRRDGAGGIGADAGQFPQSLLGVGKPAAQFTGNGAGAGVQVACPGIVAEPRPGAEHLIERGRGQRLDARPALHEAQEVRRDGGCRRLLQHDFGQPDAIGIGRFARFRPPRQAPAVAVVPGQKRRGVTRL
jgi:hypothetical protein